MPPSSHIRAAFDIGSSHHKLTVAHIHADAPTDSSTPPNLTILHSSSIRVPLAESLNNTPSKNLPSSILQQSRTAINTLRSKAISLGAQSMSAIATAVFRSASNGPSYLSTLGMPVTILSAEDEGAFAFRTAMVTSCDVQVKERNTIVWDSGGGSTQWTFLNQDNEFIVHALPFGSGVVRKAFVDRANNVALLAEWIKGKVIHYNNVVLNNAITQKIVVGIGNDSSMFAIAATIKGSVSFNACDVDKAISKYVNSGNQVEITSAVPKLVLLKVLMQLYGIHCVRWSKANGSCIGLLISQDIRFWPPVVTASHAPVINAVEDAVLV